MDVKLKLPGPTYWKSYFESLDEIDRDGDVKGMNWDGLTTPGQYFKDALDMKEGRNLGSLVACTNFWIIYEDEYCGRMSIRHELNEFLRSFGGHIGYEVKTSARKKGIATKALSLALEYCRDELHLHDLLLTCADDNIGSIKTIEKNGGTLIQKKTSENRISRFYQIKI